jgi:hypothetical protein
MTFSISETRAACPEPPESLQPVRARAAEMGRSRGPRPETALELIAIVFASHGVSFRCLPVSKMAADITDGLQRYFLLSSRDVFKVSRLGRYNCRILIVGVGMQRREFSPGRPAVNSAGWNHAA